jgi:hypothetical protein
VAVKVDIYSPDLLACCQTPPASLVGLLALFVPATYTIFVEVDSFAN